MGELVERGAGRSFYPAKLGRCRKSYGFSYSPPAIQVWTDLGQGVLRRYCHNEEDKLAYASEADSPDGC